MAEFMEENDDRQHEKKGDDVADEAMAQRTETVQKKIGHSLPLTQGRRPCPQPSRMPLRQFEARGRQLYFSHYGQRRLHHRLRSTGSSFPTLSSRSTSPRPVLRSRRT